MKRYTLIINYRYRDTTYQIEADNLREVQHRLIDENKIEGIGAKACRQLHLDIDDPRW